MKTYYVTIGTKTINGVIVESKTVVYDVPFAVAMNTAAIERSEMEASFGKFVHVTPVEQWTTPTLVGSEHQVHFVRFDELRQEGGCK